MLYCYVGSDTRRIRRKAHATVSALLAKKPDAAFRHFTEGNFGDSTAFEEMVSGGQGLFSSKSLVLLDCVCERGEDVRDRMLACVKEMALSENIFIVAESALLSADVKKLSTHAHKIERFDVLARGKTDKGKEITFAVGNALFGARDRRHTWVLFQKALRVGVSAEQINGALFWKVKTMLAGGRFGRYFSQRELEEYSARLVEIYHGARAGRHDFSVALEQFILSI